MSILRMKAVLLQEYYITRHAMEVQVDLLFVSFITIVVFGYVLNFLTGTTPEPERYYILMGLMLWEIIRIAQYSMSVEALWNIWSHNLGNMFIAPLTLGEYTLSQMLSSIVKAFIDLLSMGLLAAILFDFDIRVLGLANLGLFFLNLMFFAWSSGMVILGLIFRYGTRIQALAWGLIGLFQPLTAALFPLKFLPAFVQPIALLFPPTYIFEAARVALTNPAVDWNRIGIAFGLNIVYFVISFWFFTTMFVHSRNSGQFARNEQ